jgi:hypothetical protein
MPGAEKQGGCQIYRAAVISLCASSLTLWMPTLDEFPQERLHLGEVPIA